MRGELHTSDIARRQYGVISLEQLREAGISDDQVIRWVREKRLHRLHRGVYAVGHTRLIDHARLIAALLACGSESFLSHRSAAAVWGLRPVAVRAIEVTVPKGARRAPLIVHRTRDTSNVTTRNGLRVSSVPRLLVELAPREKPGELDRLITAAIRRNLLSLDEMEHALEVRRPGSAKLKRALRDYRPRTDRRSDLERAFHRLIVRAGIPAPRTNVHIGGWEIDCWWPEHGLAVELDGRNYHSAIRDTERDRYKDAQLMRRGIRVLRITDHRLELDGGGVLDDLRALLELR